MSKVKMVDKWMLFLLTCMYMFGELGHYLIGVVSRSIAQDLKYGDQSCLVSPTSTNSTSKLCENANSSMACEAILVSSSEPGCVWDYNGLGIEYQYLAGPSFIVAFTIAGVVWGIIGDIFNRVTLLSIGTILFSLGLTITAFATKYWHVVLLRALLAIGEAACPSIAASMISDVFPQEQRAFAMGLFNWGIYIGYGFSYAVGNYVTEANILNYGWRPCFIISGVPGLFVAALFFLTVKDPSNSTALPKAIKNDDDHETNNGFESKVGNKNKYVITNTDSPSKKVPSSSMIETNGTGDNEGNFAANGTNPTTSTNFAPFEEEENYWAAWKSCLSPTTLILGIAACIRHTGGFTWGYNSALYFQQYYPEYDAGWWLTCISIFGGAAGSVIGGYTSDRLVSRLGISARALVLAGSQLLATPFTIGLLYLDPPLAFFSLLIGYLVAEMWFGVLLAIMVELVPAHLKSTVIGLALFVMNNVGGNLPILVAPVTNIWNLRTAITIFYPGTLFTSSVLFFLCCFLLRGGGHNK